MANNAIFALSTNIPPPTHNLTAFKGWGGLIPSRLQAAGYSGLDGERGGLIASRWAFDLDSGSSPTFDTDPGKLYRSAGREGGRGR